MKRLSLLLCLVVAPSLTAQRDLEPPKRPMISGADTNDARAYYEWALSKLVRQPKDAAAGFYWAARLSPIMAEAFYGRRVALLLTDGNRLRGYWTGDKNTLRRDDIKRIDSLYLHALMLNPFLYERLDRELQDAIIRDIATRASGNGSSMELEFAIREYLRTAGPGERAFRAYTGGQFQDALKYYAVAIEDARYKHYYRSMRGRLFFQIGEADSAQVELSRAVDEMRKRDKKDLVYVYESKALLEHSIGMAWERLSEYDKAREAYGRALQEDLGYTPAHVRLAYLAWGFADTAAALSEFDLAVQVRPDDEALRFQYGYMLVEAGKLDDAQTHLRKSIEINPVFSLPYFALARAYERQGKASDAVTQYRAFLALSSQQDARRAEAQKAVQSLASKSP